MRRFLHVLLFVVCGASPACANETIWLEAEHMDGVRGYCWPMGRPDMKKTDGHWALSGPGWAAEWNQGGESGFLSIATAADDDRAVATKTVEVPEKWTYHLWVRYGDWREETERFRVRIEQEDSPAWEGAFGEQPRVEEDNEMKLYFGWAHGIGWIVISLLCIDAVRRRVIPLWLGVTVVVIGGLGPFAGSAGFIYYERRIRRQDMGLQRGMV